MKLVKRCFFFSTIFLIAIIFVSCDLFGDVSSTQDGGSINGHPGGTPDINTGEHVTEYTANTPSRDITSADFDKMETYFTSETTVVDVDLDNRKIGDVSITEGQKGTILENVTFQYADGLIKINSKKYANNICFKIHGTITGYGVQIKTNDSYKTKVILNGASITSESTPCLSIKTDESENNLFYVVLEGSNTLTDGRSYGKDYSEDNKGTLFSDGALIFSGDGTLTITEGYKHGIASKDYIKVNNGTITINSTGRNGFQAVNGFIMNDGSVTINGTGTHTNNQSRGIVVEGSEENPGEGFIVINGGSLNITTVSKGITAKWDANLETKTTDPGDATDTDTTNDPYPYVKITGGNITIKTTGKPTEGKNGTYTDADGQTVTEEIKLAPEGIEGKQAVFISGGTLDLNCTDDCINSSRDGSAKIEISGGNIYAVSTTNDAIDSNGSLTISGGNVVAIATNDPECAFDCDKYTFAITGGYVAGIGTSNYSEPTTSDCSQGVLVLASSYLGSAGKTIAVKNSSNNVVYAFTIPTGTSVNGCVGIFSCPNFSKTGSYTLVKGATASSGSSSNGLYTSMPTITGGTSHSGISFSSNYVYTAGSPENQGAQEGSRQ